MIYLDNAGTTPVSPECAEIFNRYQCDRFFNPSAPYHEALEIGNSIKSAREQIVRALRGSAEDTLVFTSSGTESDNMVLFGAKKSKNARIIVSASEHPAVYNAAMELKNRGYDVVFCEVDTKGRVIEERFREYLTPETDLISIMHVNNETGCVNDLKTLCRLAKSVNPNVLFHSDGVQALGKIDVSMRDTGVDAYTISGHKIHGVKGTAGLYLKKGVRIKPLLYGGGQESGLRSSTENVGGILSFAYAVQQATENEKQAENDAKELRRELMEFFTAQGIQAVDSGQNQSPFILCAVMPYVRGEVLLHALEKHGILIGTGSACSSKKAHKKLPSILQLSPIYENGIIRISFSRFTTKSDIEYFENSFNLEYNALKKYLS